jgi:hypothetical protein
MADMLKQIHTTLINTNHRTPKPPTRIPFDYEGLLTSSAFANVSAGPPPSWLTAPITGPKQEQASDVEAVRAQVEQAGDNPVKQLPGHPERAAQTGGNLSELAQAPAPRAKVRTWPIPVDFGTWDVDELQICDMGRFGPDGELAPIHRISLVRD